MRLPRLIDRALARRELKALHARNDGRAKTPVEMRQEAAIWRRLDEPGLAAIFERASWEEQ